MAVFDEILSSLHDNATLTDSEKNYVTIDNKRSFTIPEGYDTVLAYSGDVNSQIVTFQIPKFHEGHDLSKCEYKKLKWKNLTSGFEGSSDLIIKTVEENTQILKWEIPPEAFTQAGILEISLSLYDEKNGKIAFSWNTPTSTVFSVGSGFEEVPLDLTLPAENEILLICENKQIVAPKGYNNHIANFGDVGTSKIYFQCKKSIAGINITDDSAKVQILVNFNDATNPSDSIEVKEISQDSVLITWNVPDWVTNNDKEYFGNIKISLVFNVGNENNKKFWKTSPFSSLYIGETLIKDSDGAATAPTLEEEVNKLVTDFIENSNEIGRADWEQEDQNGKGYIANKPPVKKGSGEGSIEENGGKATGLYSYASGQNTQAMGMGSRAEGKDTISKGHYSHAEGLGTQAYGHRSHAEGNGTVAGIDEDSDREQSDGAHAEGEGTLAIGNGAHAEGFGTKASGEGAHAEGSQYLSGDTILSSRAEGRGAHAEGSGTYACAKDAHAEGRGTTASGEFSHAEGVSTQATKYGAHAEGSWTKAGGEYSHAEGSSGQANHANAHVEGVGTISTNDAQHVQGRYNDTTVKNLAHIVGGGTGWTNKKNIHTLDWNGNAWFAGDVFVDGTNQLNGQKLATEDFVNNLGYELQLYKVNADWRSWKIPNNAGRFFYIGTTECDYSITVDDQPAGGMSTTNISVLYFCTGNPSGGTSYISSIRIKPNSFYQIPENANYIEFNEELPGWDVYTIFCPPLYFLGVKTNG